MLASRLLKATAVAISFWTLHDQAFAEPRDAATSSSKAEATKPARKNPVKEKAQSGEKATSGGAPAAGNRPPPPTGAESGAAAQPRPRSTREENLRKAPLPPLAPLAPPDITQPPPRLPPASREKMRACAIEWSKLRLEAKNPMPLWRDFGAQCLKR